MLSAPTLDGAAPQATRVQLDGSARVQHSAGRPAVAPRLRPSQLPLPRPPGYLPRSVITAIGSPGRPLAAAQLSEEEARFGVSLEDIRLHTDASEAGSARAINARAYTFGQHIVFGPSEYSPASPSGAALLRHEIAHVLQQRGGTSNDPGLWGRPERESESQRASLMGGNVPEIVPRGTVGIERQTSQSDLMALSDTELEAEQAGVEGWLQQHAASDEEYYRYVAYLTNIHAVMRQRRPAREARAQRQQWEKQVLKAGGAVALVGGPVLGWLGVGPIAGTFVYEFSQGILEAIDEQPPERKQQLFERFNNLYYTWGNWGDKYDYTKGYLWGIVLGIWGEIEGIGQLFVLLYDINKKVNEWLFSTGSQLFENWDAMVVRAQALYDRLAAVLTKAGDEITAFLQNPDEALKRLQGMLDAILESALTKANDFGHEAVDKVFSFLEEPFGQLGKDIGKVVGALIFNIVLLVASDAIGNLIKEGAALVARIGRAIFEGVAEVGRAAASFVTKIVELVRGVGRKILSSELVEALLKVFDDIVEFFKGLIPKVKEAVVPGEEPPLGAVKKLGEGTRVETAALEELPPKPVPRPEPGAGAAAMEPIRPSLRGELDQLVDAAEAFEGHPEAEKLADKIQEAERLLADPSRQSEAADAIRDLRRAMDEMEEVQMEGATEPGFEGAREAGLTELEPWEPPAGAEPKPELDAPKDVRRRWLKKRLQLHIEEARHRFLEEGLTEAQEIALRTEPKALPRFRGSRIHGFAQSTVLRDAELAEVITAPDFVPEPDFIDSILPDWFDATTEASWHDHLVRYGERYGIDWGSPVTIR